MPMTAPDASLREAAAPVELEGAALPVPEAPEPLAPDAEVGSLDTTDPETIVTLEAKTAVVDEPTLTRKDDALMLLPPR